MEPEKYFYYINDPDTGKKRVTVCLLKKGESVARGVAICSDIEPEYDFDNPKDQFNKKLGRTIAEGRAWKAYRRFRTCQNNKIKNEEAGLVTPHEFISKSEWMPSLTEFEKTILK